MLANLFAGIVLIMEKPFILGENISTPRVQGKVEDISFRSTKIRAGDQSLVTVPNATLANEPITNLSRMDKRKISFYVSLAADTPAEKILSCMDKIRQLLLNTPGLQEDGIKVNLEILSASSIDILVSCFTVGNQGEDYLANRQIINLGIIEILRQENLTMAASTANIK
ncbi:mechanosensitive ion channel family protein [Syntrophomonas palmitatica]|uniref:mechanosensitive ion channel family protein n=1 Tax=Syntrophomonas palmitatica TaxID=402877 RepID=UPI00155DC332|nr:mechanosensitive ion channel domain-containing protein [Syntrophomonas palmitatica]